MMMMALKMTAERMALCGFYRRMMFRERSAGMAPMNMAG